MPLHLLVKWGRWFLQIVDIHVGNFNMKLTGRWFPQIVNRTVGIYIQYIYNKNCGVSFWTCSREISGDRVALFPLLCICLLCDEVLLPWHFHSPGFDIRALPGPPPPQIWKKSIMFAYFKNFLSDCFLIWHVHRYGWQDSWKTR